MTAKISGPRWRTVGALAIGVIMIICGVLLTLHHQFDRLDGDARIAAQIAGPTMHIAAIGPNSVPVVVTMFAEESGHTKFVFEPRDFTDEPVQAEKLLVTIKAVGGFTWKTTNDVNRVMVDQKEAGRWKSKITPNHSGDGTSFVFTVSVGAGASLATIDVTTHDPFVTRGGGVVLAHVPSVQVIYNDSIEDPEITSEIQDLASHGDADRVSNLLANAASVGSLDGVPMYTPLLTVRASAPQLDLVHPTWRSVTVYPTPTDSNPLNWKEELKFIPYLEYEDLAFQNQTEREQLGGGLLIGLGAGVLLMPLTAFLERPKRVKSQR